MASSIFIIVMMFFSVGGVVLAGYNKVVNPKPIEEGIAAVTISLFCGITMLILSAYQYAVGKRNSSFAIMCQAVDSRNHFLVSLLVCAGIILSRAAAGSGVDRLYYANLELFVKKGNLSLEDGKYTIP
jgi:divalent metal cation (Fe/Co/Zn/Cd) transporter